MNPTKSNEIVGYTVDGDPITVADLEKAIELSNKDFENGDYIDNKDLLDEALKWRKKS